MPDSAKSLAHVQEAAVTMPVPKPYAATDGTVTWRVRFRVHDPLGDYINTSETFPTFNEAQRFCELIKTVGTDEAVRHLADRRHDDASPTLDAWVERYITTLTGIEDGTKVDYRRIYNRTWKPLIGGYRLSELTKERIAAALNELSGRLSDKSIRNAWGSFFAPAIREAHEDGVIDKNPCRGIRLPRRTEHERTEHRYLTYDEFDRLLEQIPELWKPLVITLAGTGVRWGEAQVLTVGDVDYTPEVPVLRIIKAAKWTGVSKRKTGPPKSRRSRRSVTLPPQVVDALRTQTEGRPRGERLFTVADEPIQHMYFWKHVWRPALKRADLDEPLPRIHDLRHSHASWLIALGIGLPVIQARLGHESIKTTIDTYGHLMPDVQAAAAHAASVAFSQVPSLPVAGELEERKP